MTEAKCIQLGRYTVSYRSLGQRKRKILFFHGFPGSSLQLELFRPCLESHDLQVIAFDRPGYNQTSFDSNQQLPVTLEIAEALTKKLGWKKFEVFCVSGGAPFGLTYTFFNQANVSHVSVICGLGPLQLPEFRRLLSPQSVLALRLAKFIPGRLVQNTLARYRAVAGLDQQSRIGDFFLPRSPHDLMTMRDSEVAAILQRCIQEAFLQAGAGPKRDTQTFLAPWGWALSDFATKVKFWHGRDDRLIPFAMSEQMASLLPQAELRLIHGEGHYSLPIRRISEIISDS